MRGYIHIMWMYIDHLWSQSWVSPLCSGTLLQLPYTCIFFFLSVRVSLRKKWSQEKSTENPSDILRFPIFIRDSLRAHRRYGLNFSLPAVFFFILFREKNQTKKYKKSEPVTCAWASTVPFRNTYGFVLKKAHWVIFSSWRYALNFFRGKKTKKKTLWRHIFQKKNVSEHKGSQEAPWTGASTMVMSEHDALS